MSLVNSPYTTDDELQVCQSEIHSNNKRSIQVQTEIIQRDYISLQDLKTFQLESQAFPKILQKSHNIKILIFALIIISFSSKYLRIDDSPDSLESLRINGSLGYVFASLFLIFYGAQYLPNTLIQRPHPVLWRLVQSFGLCWLLVVTCANFFGKQNMQQMLQIIDPNLGPQNFIEKDYAQNCEFFTFNHPQGILYFFRQGLFDLYFWAHFFGWFFKMLAIRNFWLCQFQSFIFEALEFTLKVWLENFAECWWDSILHDLILANTGGMLVAWYLIKKFKMKEYTIKEMNIFSSAKRYSQFIFLLVTWNLIDLSHFFNKYALKISESHTILAVRIWIIGFIAIPAFREFFIFITDKSSKRLGPCAWIMLAITFFEWRIFLKNYEPSSFQNDLTVPALTFWGLLIGGILAIQIYLISRDFKRQCLREKQKKQIKIVKKQHEMK